MLNIHLDAALHNAKEFDETYGISCAPFIGLFIKSYLVFNYGSDHRLQYPDDGVPAKHEQRMIMIYLLRLRQEATGNLGCTKDDLNHGQE